MPLEPRFIKLSGVGIRCLVYGFRGTQHHFTQRYRMIIKVHCWNVTVPSILPFFYLFGHVKLAYIFHALENFRRCKRSRRLNPIPGLLNGKPLWKLHVYTRTFIPRQFVYSYMVVFVQAYVSNDFVITLLYSLEYFLGFVVWLSLRGFALGKFVWLAIQLKKSKWVLSLNLDWRRHERTEPSKTDTFSALNRSNVQFNGDQT